MVEEVEIEVEEWEENKEREREGGREGKQKLYEWE